MSKTPRNIETAGPQSLNWDSTDVSKALRTLLAYVENEAKKASDWYWQNKYWKAACSRSVQFLAVVLTALGGIIPIVGQLTHEQELTSGLWASLLVGIAAALLGLDKAFGFSTGWARYVVAATNIRKTLEDFRFDWVKLIASMSSNPSPEQIAAMINRAREFRIAIDAIVLQETKDWVNEFQSNMAQMETDVKAQLTKLKAELEEAAEAKRAETQPGSVELAITNADKTDGDKVQVRLDGTEGAVTNETVSGSKTWACLDVRPGHYRVTVSGAVAGKQVSAVSVVIVRPGEISKSQIALIG